MPVPVVAGLGAAAAGLAKAAAGGLAKSLAFDGAMRALRSRNAWMLLGGACIAIMSIFLGALFAFDAGARAVERITFTLVPPTDAQMALSLNGAYLLNGGRHGVTEDEWTAARVWYLALVTERSESEEAIAAMICDLAAIPEAVWAHAADRYGTTLGVTDGTLPDTVGDLERETFSNALVSAHFRVVTADAEAFCTTRWVAALDACREPARRRPHSAYGSWGQPVPASVVCAHPRNDLSLPPGTPGTPAGIGYRACGWDRDTFSEVFADRAAAPRPPFDLLGTPGWSDCWILHPGGA